MPDFNPIFEFIRSTYNTPEAFIPLHEPRFIGNEKKYVNDCIDSTFVSSVGKYVDQFEQMIVDYTGAKHAIAIVNGTSALHLALELAGVQRNDLVVTQALSFVATANAIKYTGAEPYFIDIDKSNLGMSVDALKTFFNEVELIDGQAYYKPTKQRVSAIVPMHTFGFPAAIDELVALANEYNIPLVEDAAESLGSTFKGKHTGTFGLLGTYSFNGNKTITCGGGGIIVTNDSELAKRAKHLSTQAKIAHPWEYNHDAVGYNYRCPNLNAALACAQLEKLEEFIENKRETAKVYHDFFQGKTIQFIDEPDDSRSNYWLNAILLSNEEERNQFLKDSNASGVMTRPVWTPLNEVEYLKNAKSGNLDNCMYIAERLVNIPSSVRLQSLK